MDSSHPRPPVTLRDVAKTLGVSHVTVSLALRNNPQIPASRRAWIQETAARMGYRPNAVATALALHKHTHALAPINAALAWINHWPQPPKLRSYIEYDRYWQGASAAAEKFGYRLEEFCGGERMALSQLEKVLLARGIRGILLPPHPPATRWEGLHWERFSAMRFGRSIPSPRLHLVTSDQVANAMLAFGEMRRRGYERVGFVTGHAAERGDLHKAGFMMAQEWVSPSQRLPVCVLDEKDLPASRRRLAAWLREARPGAILTDVAAARTMLAKIGCRVPEDVGLAALSILDGDADAGIDQHPEEIGRVAVLLILSLMNASVQGVPPIFRQILIEGSWVDGATLPWRHDLAAPGKKRRAGAPSHAPRVPAKAARRNAKPAGSVGSSSPSAE